jgi:peptidoglycan/xylan/chitin deacetylase (PgdA/CDA1 family)
MTFDDGHVSIYEKAFPHLCESTHTIIFISPGFIGRPDWLSAYQIREMHRHGINIGAHGYNHCNLLLLPHEQMMKELSQSKTELENIIGETVTSMSLVGGHYNRAVIRAAREISYRTIYSSQPTEGIVHNGITGRLCIFSITSLKQFKSFCAGNIPIQRKLNYFLNRPIHLLYSLLKKKYNNIY